MAITTLKIILCEIAIIAPLCLLVKVPGEDPTEEVSSWRIIDGEYIEEELN